MRAVLAVIVLSDLCLAIRVPVTWLDDSAVNNETQITSENRPIIPNEYFVYKAKKPQFAVNVAAFHGVQYPENHYKAYPVRPYTEKPRPELGKHKIFDHNNPVFQNFQDFAHLNQPLKNEYPDVKFEVFHPYKAEEQALNQIYKDPVLDKIRNDIRDSKNSLQKYENEAGKPNISSDEYLEPPEETDRKKFPHRNNPVHYEIHRPQRKPIYYRHEPIYSNRDHVLNRRFKHPWNINYAKIRPVNYRPLKNHLSQLKHNQAIKYDDERNQYPQLPLPEAYGEPVDGYDIYVKGRDKYKELRNNVDESINNAVKQNRPDTYQKLELYNNDDASKTLDSEDNDEEFVPVKNYAQVRKSETYKHLPRTAAFDDAVSFDEIKNAPRLREAVKSTKAQTVYSEEGYEDAAYDHAGEQKHASENEGHEGYLKEKELSGGNYKTPSLKEKYQDANGNAYQDQSLHGKQWKNSEKDKEAESEAEDYAEDDHSIESDIYLDVTVGRNKRQNDDDNNSDQKNYETADKDSETSQELEPAHGQNNVKADISDETSDEQEKIEEREVGRRKRENIPESNHEEIITTTSDATSRHESNFKVPEINYTTTFLNDDELVKIANIKIDTKKENLRDKYPYYFKDLISVHKHSPLRYAENLKLIPKKTKGGTEFYDSRSQFECPDVDETLDVLPEKLKKDGHPDETGDKDEKKANEKANFDRIKDNPRLRGLGDKIDCFKAKYFGENPLDSPFFKEDIIENPEPVTAPNTPTYKLKTKEVFPAESVTKNVFILSEKLKNATKTDVQDLLNKLKNGQNQLQESLVKNKEDFKSSSFSPNVSLVSQFTPQASIQSEVLDKIKSIMEKPVLQERIDKTSRLFLPTVNDSERNINYNSSKDQQNITKQPSSERRKRAAPFVYEPYKIIKEGQFQDFKKPAPNTNATFQTKKLPNNKLLSREFETTQNDQSAKRNSTNHSNKDIGRHNRTKPTIKGSDSSLESIFVDVNTDKRRGEPRYELLSNVGVNYELQKDLHDKIESQNEKQNESLSQNEQKVRVLRNRKQPSTTAKPYFDVTQFLPKPSDSHSLSASSKVINVMKPENRRKSPTNEKKVLKVDESSANGEEYEDYYDQEEQSPPIITTTSSTVTPVFKPRTKFRSLTTTEPTENEKIITEPPKLRLITRFRDVPHEKLAENNDKETQIPKTEVKGVSAPQYREKKRKTSESTLVTDTNTYGGDIDADKEDNMRMREVDSLIGIKQNMDDYTPLYEKEDNKKRNKDKELSKETHDDDEEEYDEDDDDDDEDEDEEEDDESEESEEYDDDESDDQEETTEQEIPTTTPEPTKMSLIRTTEGPPSTTEARSAKLELRPTIMKTKIEIHNEIPANNSSPHKVQFKQDIKEIEIIKEMPAKHIRKKPNKHVEVLDLYKDDNLAKEINKLSDVEIFKQNLDFRTGPKHGGNYKREKFAEQSENTATTPLPNRTKNLKSTKSDAETSQSTNNKLIKLRDFPASETNQEGNLRVLSDVNTSKNSKIEDTVFDKSNNYKYNDKKNEKLVELSDSLESYDDVSPYMHGGNFKAITNNSKNRNSNRNEKFVELEDSSEDTEESTQMHGGNLKAARDKYKPRGEARSEKLTVRSGGAKDNNARSKIQKHGGHLKANIGKPIKQNRSEKLTELEDSSENNSDEPTTRMHGGNLKSDSPEKKLRMHGGNFKSYGSTSNDDEMENMRYRAKLIQAASNEKDEETDEKSVRSKSARLLNSFAQAVPILTTTPAYILDPSKRMYYYVDD